MLPKAKTTESCGHAFHSISSFYNFTNFANLNIQASEPTSAMLDDRQFYTTTVSFAKTYKSNDAEGQRSVLFKLITLTERPES